MSFKSFSILFFVVMVFVSPFAMALEKPFVKNGNIYLNNGKRILQLTHSGKDSSPVVSSDEKIVAFIRTDGKPIPEACLDFVGSSDLKADRIWIYELKTKKERLLVNNNFNCSEPVKKIVNPNNLQFSPDSKLLYFLTSAWVTSTALHVAKIDGSSQQYFMPALSFQVIPQGQYKDYLIVEQHRYFISGGSFDWLYLFSPAGKEEGVIGEELTASQKDYIFNS